MAKYTIELRKLQARFYEAMQDYPIFDESYRETLNDKIYHACKMREIGFETPELFLEQLAYWMDLHMPEYNWLYKANLVELTPLQRSQIMETMNRIKNYDESGEKTENRQTIKDYESITESEQNANTNQIGQANESTINKQEVNANNNQISHNTETNENTVHNEENTENNNVSSDESETIGYHSDFPQANLTDQTNSNYYTTGDKQNSKNNSQATDNTAVVGESQEEGGSESHTEVSDNTSSIEENEGETERKTQTNTNQNTVGKNKNSVDDITHNIGSASDSKEGEERETQIKSKLSGDGFSDFELLEQYRKSFVNVDNRIIRALKKDLFLNIWS